MKKDQMTINIAQQIIRGVISNEIAFNIMNLKDLKEIWDKLKIIYIKIDQEVVYSILQKLLYYSKITKSL